MNEIELYYNRIAVNPEIYQQHNTERIAVMHRFPYKIVYQVEKEEVVVLAVFHTKRNPKRLPERR